MDFRTADYSGLMGWKDQSLDELRDEVLKRIPEKPPAEKGTKYSLEMQAQALKDLKAKIDDVKKNMQIKVQGRTAEKGIKVDSGTEKLKIANEIYNNRIRAFADVAKKDPQKFKKFTDELPDLKGVLEESELEKGFEEFDSFELPSKTRERSAAMAISPQSPISPSSSPSVSPKSPKTPISPSSSSTSPSSPTPSRSPSPADEYKKGYVSPKSPSPVKKDGGNEAILKNYELQRAVIKNKFQSYVDEGSRLSSHNLKVIDNFLKSFIIDLATKRATIPEKYQKLIERSPENAAEEFVDYFVNYVKQKAGPVTELRVLEHLQNVISSVLNDIPNTLQSITKQVKSNWHGIS